MAYNIDEMGMGPGGNVQFEVRVHALGGQRQTLYVDKFGLMGDVKQRIANEMRRKFHELKILVNQTQEPDAHEKVSAFRGRGGTVDLTVVVNRTCRWCHAQIADRNTVNCKLDTDLGDFCSMRCYTLMNKEVQEQNNVFTLFGIGNEPREMAPSQHYSMPQYGDHWPGRY